MEQLEVFRADPRCSMAACPGGMVNLIAKRPQREASHNVSLATGTGALKGDDPWTAPGPSTTGSPTGWWGWPARRRGQAVTSKRSATCSPPLDWQLGEAHPAEPQPLYYQKDPAAGIYHTVPASGSVKSNPWDSLAATASSATRTGTNTTGT